MEGTSQHLSSEGETPSDSRNNVEHTSESKKIIQEDLENLSQSGFSNPVGRLAEDRDSGSDAYSIKPEVAAKATR